MEEKVILLVEDNPDDVVLTKMALQKSRIVNKLVVAQDGEEALDYLFDRGKSNEQNSSQLPEVVLLDLKLPRIDGLEVLRQVRANPATCMLPVVVLTSSSEDQDIIKSYKLGCNSFITKPVDFDQFVKAVQQLQMYWLVLNKNPNSPKSLKQKNS
jgi:two-component system, response regulator